MIFWRFCDHIWDVMCVTYKDVTVTYTHIHTKISEFFFLEWIISCKVFLFFYLNFRRKTHFSHNVTSLSRDIFVTDVTWIWWLALTSLPSCLLYGIDLLNVIQCSQLNPSAGIKKDVLYCVVFVPQN